MDRLVVRYQRVTMSVAAAELAEAEEFIVSDDLSYLIAREMTEAELVSYLGIREGDARYPACLEYVAALGEEASDWHARQEEALRLRRQRPTFPWPIPAGHE